MVLAFRFVDWPLRAKLAALLVAASLLPLTIWAIVDLRQDEARMLNSLKTLLEARGDQIVRELDTFHRAYQRSADGLARFPTSSAYCADAPEQRAARRVEMLGILAAYPASDAGIRGAALLDASGRVVIASEAPLIGLDLSDRPNVSTALQGGTVITDPFISSPGSGSVATIAYFAPAFDAERRVRCVAVLWVRATAFWNAVKTSNALAGPGSFAVLFDREGIRIAHTYSDDVIFHPAGPLDATTLERLVAERRFGASTRALLEDVRSFPEQFERARAATPDPSVFRGFAAFNQTWNYGVARRFDTVPWTAFYMVPEAQLASEIAAALRQRGLLAAVVIAAAALIGLLFGATILRPIRALDRVASAISSGDLSARVDNPRGDELGRLGVRFNAMVGQIQLHAADLQRSRDELEVRVHERTAELQAEIEERVRMEGVLRERDAALRRAHVMSKLAHVITSFGGTFETWSDTLPPMIGLAPAEMPRSTRDWLALLHPDDRKIFRDSSLAAGASGTSKEVEYRLRRADGQWIRVRQAIEPLPGPPGADGAMRWFSTLQDVTQQRRAEDELRESQQLLHAIIDNSAALIYVKDIDGRYLLINRRYAELFRIDAAAVVGKTDHDLFPDADADRYRAMDARVMAADAPLIEEEVAALDDGAHTFVSVKCPLREQNGTVYGVFGISTDITDRKQAESRLKAQVQHLELLDQITRAIGERQDLQSIYQVAIRSLEERLPVGFSCVLRYDAPDSMLTVIRVGAHSRPLAMELALEETSRIAIDQNGLARCVAGELVYEPDIEATPFAFPQRLARGGLRSLVVAPLQSESRVFGVLVVARQRAQAFSSADCEFLRQLSAHVALAAQQAELHEALQRAYDELRQSQQTVMQQERLRALGQMASGIAHDINNAISPVALYTESLLEREPNLSERGRAHLVTIARAIEDVAATVARMREFYRERGTQLTLRPVQLNSLVQQVIDLTRARWSDMPQQRGAVIRLETDLEPDLPDILGIDSEVREALINLVFNAVDAMPDGGVLSFRTRSTVADDATRCAEVVVGDSGIGMDEQTRRRCLEPFFTTKGERGTGLGLAMVYGAVQRHGATVDVDSTPGAGTAVRLRFPVPARAPLTSDAYPPPEVPLSRLRILIIDDDPVISSSLCYMLEADGHAVVTAGGGAIGIEMFGAAQRSAEGFDAVITDLGMPNVDGRQVAEAVKKISAATPVILLTGWGQRLLAEGDVPSHVDRVLSKPPKMREVRAALAQLARPSATPSDEPTKDTP